MSLVVLAAPGPDPAGILHGWDAAREAAYVAADGRALRDLYDDPALAASDVDVLRQWRSQGWRVSGLRSQYFSLRVDSRAANSVSLEVSERTLTTVSGHGRCRLLPASAPRRQLLTLVLREGRWRLLSAAAPH